MATAARRYLAVGALVLSALVLAVAGARADTVRVTVEALEIRSEPSPQAKVVGSAQRGEFLEVVEETGSGWLMVRLPGSSKLGFVEDVALQRLAPAPAAGPETTPSQAAPAPRPTPPAQRPVERPRRAPRRTWERVAVMVSGGLTSGQVDASEMTAFSMYHEDTGRLSTRYEFGGASGLDLALRGQALSWLGGELALSTGSRDGSGTTDAVVPHPLYFSRDRQLEREIEGLALKTRAIHASVVLTHRRGRLRGSVFGGITFFSVKADVLQELQFDQVYPFDTDDVAVGAAHVERLEDSPRVPSFGASLDVTLHRYVGLGVMARYASATARLSRQPASGPTQERSVLGTQSLWPGTETPVEIGVGGLRLAFGARLYF